MKTVYHYTKGYKIGQIILGLEINAMSSSGLGVPNEKLVWLTKEETYPLSALPAIPEIPETHMMNQLKKQQPVDFNKVASAIGGIWRFKFDLELHPEIKAWYGSYQRNKLVKSAYGKILEQTARQVGDRLEMWSIASGKLSIINSTLQQLTPNGWVDRLQFHMQAGEAMVDEIGKANITKITLDSIRIQKAMFG
jgi:hypothetical protein